MNLIVIHKNYTDNGGESLLHFALTSEPVADVILDRLSSSLSVEGKRTSGLRFAATRNFGKAVCAIPEEWAIESVETRDKDGIARRSSFCTGRNMIRYQGYVPIPFESGHITTRKGILNSWFVVTNGRFVTEINNVLLKKVLTEVKADVLAVNVEPDLLSEREKIRLTNQGKVAGFRRLYSDSVELVPFTTDWPHHLLIQTNVLEQVLADGLLPQSFSALLEKFNSQKLTLLGMNIAGRVLDLETEEGLLKFCGAKLSEDRSSDFEIRGSNTISEDSRFIGKVLLGKNVRVAPKVIVVGPSIICDNVKIERGAIINSSIVGPGICLPKNQLVQDCIIEGKRHDWKQSTRYRRTISQKASCQNYKSGLLRGDYSPFRDWSKLSYSRCLKRITDFFAAVVVLILFAPLMPFVAFAIKFASPGPVFYKDKRQGLHGKEFNCLKFRTMVTGADKIQEKLRVVSQVDGPQFKMTDDPRINNVGWFLRETYIDEIPQFFNVLLGQMSVVGPRPSPEAENTMCPFWRDARLSIRPGITGLWQVYRTRQPMKDFQEWIHYDIEYVRNLSLKMDLWICWKTTKKLLGNFINQF